MTARARHEAGVDAAAMRLLAAAASGRPCAPVRDLLAADDVDLAYTVQQRITQSRLNGGACVVGRKIGLTSSAVQQQFGVDPAGLRCPL